MIKQNKPYLTYALNKDGRLVHIDEVINGNECECFCPHCHSKLCAKNRGEFKIHHFAHLHGADCKGAIESALHIMAKEVLQKTKKIILPSIPNVCNSKLLILDTVKEEYYFKELELRPDCIGYYGEDIIWIEFKRTHAVDQKKKGKIISAKINCIEIDINSCDLNYSTIEDFLTKSEENRIWIYNNDLQYYEDNTTNKINSRTKLLSNDYIDTCIERSFALEDTGCVIYARDIDANNHNYYCLHCRKEVCIDINKKGIPHFVHIDQENDKICSDELYLIDAAKEILYNNFHKSEKFEFFIDERYICSESNKCKLFNYDYCNIVKYKSYDLKHLKFNHCSKDIKLPNLIERAHLLISKQNDMENAIIVNIKSGDCYMDMPLHKNKQQRTIELHINSEYDLFILEQYSLQKKQIYTLYNFRPKENKDLKFNKEVDEFVLYKSGKIFIKNTSCEKIFASNQIDSIILKLYFSLDLSDVNYDRKVLYGLLYCFKKNIKTCYCKLCYFLKDSYYKKSFCIRYKTKGTPEFPLKADPLPTNCPYFKLNRYLILTLEREISHSNIIEIQ
ncbi:MAG: competence protein CoiA family protein [Bacteroidales bacterium]|nr:competence protein CoiA family protein [Bacteroidales bacterium]